MICYTGITGTHSPYSICFRHVAFSKAIYASNIGSQLD